MFKGSKIFKWCRGVVIVGILVGGLVSAQLPLYAKEMPYAGQKITVMLPSRKAPWWGLLADAVPEFEKKTGIKVSLDLIPDVMIRDKTSVALAARAGQYDVVPVFSFDLAKFVKAGWLRPLDPYINDPKFTPAEWGFGDFIPALIRSQSYENRIYGIPHTGGTNLLYYNKEIFEKAGIEGPPNTLRKVEEYAKKVTALGYAGMVGRTTRKGRANVYGWVMWAKLFGFTRWYDENMMPLLDSPACIEGTDFWARVLRNYGPKGIANYMWPECLKDMQQGRVAMWMDGADFCASLEDPKQSEVVGKIGYTLPEPKEGVTDNYTTLYTQALNIPNDAKHPEAAWEFIKWAESKEAQYKRATSGKVLNVTRESVLSSPMFRETYPSEWAKINLVALKVSESKYRGGLPEDTETNEVVARILSEILVGEKTAEEGMKEANREVYDILKKAGYYK